MRIYRNNQGFTLIELLLVVGIVAIILSVIVPMGLRARIDAKYGVVRQNCSELASFASQWAEKSIQAQDERLSKSTVRDYYATLAGLTGAEIPASGSLDGQWVATQTSNNWNLIDGIRDSRDTVEVYERFMDGRTGAEARPEDTVEDIVPPDKVIRNPFTEVNVFRDPNDPVTQARVINGAIALGGAVEATGDWVYYAFAFQGTDSTEYNDLKGDDTFHAGMGLNTIPQLRNGVFMGRFR